MGMTEIMSTLHFQQQLIHKALFSQQVARISVSKNESRGKGLAQSSLLTPASHLEPASEAELVASAGHWPPRLGPFPSGELGVRQHAQ